MLLSLGTVEAVVPLLSKQLYIVSVCLSICLDTDVFPWLVVCSDNSGVDWQIDVDVHW